MVSILNYSSAQEGSDNAKLTAEQIIQRAIDSCGGDALFASLTSQDQAALLITPQKDTISIAGKRKDLNKYYVSTIAVLNTAT